MATFKPDSAELPLLLALPSKAVFCRDRAAELQSATQDRDSREPIRRAMGEQFPDTPPSVRPPEDRLDSWKEIAAYLNRDVTTVQRWEKREGMPVHRHLHDRMGSVYAYRAELDAWTRSRNLRAAQDNQDNASSAPAPAAAPDSTIPTSRNWKFVLPLAAVALAIGALLWVQRTEYFWRNPISEARFQTVTDFDGAEQAAAVSRDGHFVAFLSDRDGQMDVWVTQVGSGQFHNLTHGSAKDIANPLVRALGFFSRWLSRHVLASQGRQCWRIRHRYLGGATVDWAGVGVEPDVKVKGADALETAEKLAESKLRKK
jgi:hypothetical protein